MKIIEAINRIDAVKPNNYTQPEKIEWLSRLDWAIKREIVDTHEGADAVIFDGYNDSTPLDTELIAPAPYDDVYLKWLEAQIDYANGEIGKYNNANHVYESVYTAFESWYNRNHVPLGKNFKYF